MPMPKVSEQTGPLYVLQATAYHLNFQLTQEGFGEGAPASTGGGWSSMRRSTCGGHLEGVFVIASLCGDRYEGGG